jgi:hypothetical protein
MLSTLTIRAKTAFVAALDSVGSAKPSLSTRSTTAL